MFKNIINGSKILMNFLEYDSRKTIFEAIMAEFFSVLCSMIPMFGLYNIIENIVYKDNMQNSFAWAWIILLSIVIKIIFHGFALKLSHKVAYNAVFEIRNRLILKFSKLNQGYMEENSSGKLKNIVFDDIESIEQFYGHQVPEILSSLGIPLFLGIFVFITDFRIGLVMIIPILIFLICLRKTNLLQNKNFQKMFFIQQNLNNAMVEYINAMKEIKIFGGNEKVFSRFESASENYKEFMVGWFKDSRHLMTTSDIVLASGVVFVFPVAGYLYILQEISMVKFLLYIFISLCFYSPLAKIPQFTDILNINVHIAQRVDFILKLDELSVCDNSRKICDISNNISFESVYFGYGGESVLKNLSFRVNKNEIVGLVGPSGGGKSTIVKLISRFWDVAEGNIFIDGVDIRNIRQETLSKLIAYVTQNVSVFEMSVRDNIKIGNENATDEEIVQAAKDATCHEFIKKLPNGYETILGKEGVGLSGGEKQRIAIARALLKKSPILLLDEATAYIDPDNESKLQEALSRLMKDKTVIVIAHRLSTIMNADHILVIENGEIKENGRHEELINMKGRYSEMWDAYNRGNDWVLGRGVK
ncbi:MAG: ABC transporter ATP-binding protein/permease [Tissierellales bacterium]|nr:ABC transporter ATP-binding protein/permease [Tissierellales bacterium]